MKILPLLILAITLSACTTNRTPAAKTMKAFTSDEELKRYFHEGADEKDLHFTSVRLGPQPETTSTYTRKAASQGEMRSHGFFYKDDSKGSGMLGLPISLPGRPGFKHLFENSAAILFLRNTGLQLTEIGELEAQADKAVDDRCRASCVDWYGNARPLFLRGRVFALLGYELVEGKLDNGRINELRRINYAPL